MMVADGRFLDHVFQVFVVILLLAMKLTFGDRIMGCPEKDKQALTKFKQGLIDDYRLLSSWDSDTNCCDWIGVKCSNQTGNVIKLDLGARNAYEPLRGNLSAALLELKSLSYLDLSRNDFGGLAFPKFICSLHKLTYLNLSFSELSGSLPIELGNLSNLRVLDLSVCIYMSSENFEWVSRLFSLTYLDLTGVNLSKAFDWQESLNKLHDLTELDLSLCSLPPAVNTSPQLPNSSASLVSLNLPANSLDSSIYDWVSRFGSKIVQVDISFNQLLGPIPASMGNLCNLKSLTMVECNLNQDVSDVFKALSGCVQNSLEILDLSGNRLSGMLPDLTSFSSLQNLDLHDNGLNESFPRGFRVPSSLVILNLGQNHIGGSVPDDFIKSSSLKELHLYENLLHGIVPQSVGNISTLEVLDISWNSLEGIISESHFSNLNRLQYLDLSYNSLALKFSFEWIPSFQLDIVKLRACKLGPHFPKWLSTQNNYSVLDISEAEITDIIPSWFWVFPSRLSYLNLSNNLIAGTLPNGMKMKTDSLVALDLSSNCFNGSVPPFSLNLTLLRLSKNMFSGSTNFLCDSSGKYLTYLDLSDNQFSGNLPECWTNMENLVVLLIENNMMFGKVPSSMGSLGNIRSLHLRNNKLSGKLPSTLSNCSKLIVLDLGQNQLFGSIPVWIGDDLSDLSVLSLRSNQFSGKIPISLCHLSHIQLLDLSQNNISGFLPGCISNFSAMTRKEYSSSLKIEINIGYNFDSSNIDSVYSDNELLVWKGKELEYGSTLGLVKSIDLSSNSLTGEIPNGITLLVELVGLNLSWNRFYGFIPEQIGRLELLDSLDLSWNLLSGGIPASLSEIMDISVLDLSYNNLSGSIPLSTQLQSFDIDSYVGNHLLCGFPLQNKCTKTHHEGNDDMNSEKYRTEPQWVLSSVGLGFSLGFWGVCATLLFNSSWRQAYYNFLYNMMDSIHFRFV